MPAARQAPSPQRRSDHHENRPLGPIGPVTEVRPARMRMKTIKATAATRPLINGVVDRVPFRVTRGAMAPLERSPRCGRGARGHFI
jgi:hypothetical protein